MSLSNKRKEPSATTTSSLPIPDPNQTNDLLNRLQTFLPQLQAANQALAQESATTTLSTTTTLKDTILPSRQVDKDLHQEDSSSSTNDSDDSSSSNEQESTPVDSSDITNSNQMIQIQFALTEQNDPVMNMLLEDNNDNDNENRSKQNKDDNEEEETEETSKERVVSNLLLETKNDQKQTSQTTTKKPLIVELS